MSEEKRTIVIYRIALLAGIFTLSCSLMIFPFAYFYSHTLVSPDEPHANFFAYFMLHVIYPSFYFLWPLFGISLILSIVMLFIERDKRLRLLPLAFVLFGILLNAMFFAYCLS